MLLLAGEWWLHALARTLSYSRGLALLGVIPTKILVPRRGWQELCSLEEVIQLTRVRVADAS